MNTIITEDSFGSMLPRNWQEIANYLNGILEEIWNQSDDRDDFKEVVEEVWERYCNGMLPDAPKVI